MFGMEQAEYVEWVPAGKFVRATISIVIVSMLILFAVLFVSLQPLTGEDFIGFGVFIGTSFFVLLIFMNFRGIKIQISSQNLFVKYGLFNSKCIRLDEIVSCKPVNAPIGRYGGVGVRYGVDGSYAYTTSFGNAVEINLKKERPFVFSSNNPERICELIEKRFS
jgi:hypothetical protein